MLLASFHCSAEDRKYDNKHDSTSSFIFSECALNYEFKQHGIEPIALKLSIGVKPVERLSVAFNWMPRLTLYHNDNIRTYFRNNDIIGGTVGYKVYQGEKKCSRNAFDVRATISSTLGKNNIKLTSYEFGLYLLAGNRHL